MKWLVLLLCACAGSAVRDQTHSTETLIAQARDSGAQKCAPVELAMAEANNDGAEHELDEGNYREARDKAEVAETNARAAITKSPKDKCTDRKVAVVADKDSDGDGIVDRLDNCPDEAGVKENFGCPKKKKELVEITKDQLKILDTVRFQTGTAKLSKQSNALLDNIARVMLGHLEIWKVRVDGYTDNVGKDAYNQSLSERRAKIVYDYLTAHGITADRLDGPIGHGEADPVDSNDTADGRARNRRTELQVKQ